MKAYNKLILVITAVVSMTAITGYAQNAEKSVAPASTIIELLALNRDIATPVRPKYLSPADIAASPDSQYLFVAEQTAKQIVVVDLGTYGLKNTIKLPNEVTGIAVAPDGVKLYATCSSDLWPNGMVCEVDIAAGKVMRRLPAGRGARSPVVSHDGKTLYVCNRFGNTVYVVDIASGGLTATIPVLREPYAAAITPDDSTLVVTNSIPTQKSTDGFNSAQDSLFVACKVVLISTVQKKIDTAITLPMGSHSVFGVTISPDGKYAFATHLIGLYTLPATKIDGGRIHTNNFAVIDIKNHELLNDFCLDYPSQGSADPWAIGCTKDNTILCVSHSGTSEFSLIDMQKMLDSARIEKTNDTVINPVTEKKEMTFGFSHNLSVLRTIMWKKQVSEKAPRSLAIIGTKAYSAGYFGENVEIYDLALGDDSTKLQGKIRLGAPDTVSWSSERRGEFIFSSADYCFQGWQSCQSCHPFGRADGLNWILADDVNAPKNTKSLVYSWWTPPAGWAGKRENTHESVRYAIKTQLFIAPPEYAAAQIDTFLMKLRPIASPYLVKGRLSEAASRGKEIFLHDKTIDCSVCHPGPLFTDKTFHDAGVNDPWDATAAWDTPCLIESWSTAPYNHLGSSEKMEDHIKFPRHSKASTLTQQNFNDLLEFISSM